jgi:hypothetical protein
VEAIADGVPVFKPPESKNAGQTLIAMASLLITMFLGITFLSHQFGIVPDERTHETVLSQLGRVAFGSGTPLYFLFQAATMLILVLAANTAFADFPRLSYFLARDRYMPNQFALLGDRLVFSNGILALALAASTLLVVFRGETTRLIPLYAVGVFLSFTLSQSGMVARRLRQRGSYWWLKAFISGFGATVTAAVLIVFIVTKFVYGAWIVILWIPLFIGFFLAVHRHYRDVAAKLSLEAFGSPPPVRRHRVIVPIAGVHRAVIAALNYARSISDDVTAVYVETDPNETPKIRRKWEEWGDGIPAGGAPLPVPVHRRAAGGVRGPDRRPAAAGPGGDHRAPAVRPGEVVAPSPAQPDGLAHPPGLPVPAGGHGHPRAVSPARKSRLNPGVMICPAVRFA